MKIVPTILPAEPRIRRRRAVQFGPPPPALMLVSATYDPDGPEIYLTFGRAIDIAGAVVSTVAVADPGNGYYWTGFETATLIGANEVQIVLTRGAAYGGTATQLTVSTGNGIVAADDGGLWSGVLRLALPYP